MKDNSHEHRFMADFQPLGDPRVGIGMAITSSVFNWIAVFGIAVVVGYGLRLGLGL